MRAADHHHPNKNNILPNSMIHRHPAPTTITAQLASYVGSSTTLNHFVGGVVGKRAWQNKPNTIAIGPFGFDSPTIAQYLLCLTLWGTMASILVYGRLLLPIPDLASNIKHHRRNNGSNHSTNKSSDILSRQIMKNSSNKGGGSNTISTNYSTHNNNTNDIPWAEQDYKSINNENRFRLHCTVIISGNTVRGGGIHSDTTTTRYYDVFQYELGHFSQSTVLRNLSTIQMICITLVSVCCVYRFLTNLNFLALSVVVFANVLAAFAISGPSDTTELEQISEDIRSGLMMLNSKDTTTKSGSSSTRAKKK